MIDLRFESAWSAEKQVFSKILCHSSIFHVQHVVSEKNWQTKPPRIATNVSPEVYGVVPHDVLRNELKDCG